MDLKLTNQQFLVCGASSGFGKAIAKTLLKEGASCFLTARRGDVLKDLFTGFDSERVTIIEGDLTESSHIEKLVETVSGAGLKGAVLNAGGPPAGAPSQIRMDQWDDAYQLVMRWKIDLSQRLLPLFTSRNYGRILFIESKSVKQPMPLLVLSNAFRAGVVGFAKTAALEVADKGVTINILAPGAHQTPAIERVIQKKSETEGIPVNQARQETASSIPVGRMGTAEEIASLAAWLLSVHSGYVTGQTISHDGGAISGLFG